MNDLYAIYLRKSRADLEAEARGEGETLARHRRALMELAERRGLRVVRVYEEIVSGDTIASRPQVQALLEDVQAGAYAGVIVNDIDRLARGDGIDQEIVKQTFAFSNTRIITPYKDYDLADQSDEDQIEFKLFMGRFEYKAIKRRMYLGRQRSAAEGNYLAGTDAFGYKRVKVGKKTKLEIVPEEAEIVRAIFDLYANTAIGFSALATRINEMGMRTRVGNPFQYSVVRNILINPVYAGDFYFGRNKSVQKIEDGKRVTKIVKGDDPQISRDVFPAIIDRSTFDTVQMKIGTGGVAPRNRNDMPLKNPLAGLVVCGECGRTMCKTGSGRIMLMCRTFGCATKSIELSSVEKLVIDEVRSWAIACVASEPVKRRSDGAPENSTRRQIETAEGQIDRLHDLVEQGAYTVQEYVARRDELTARIARLEAELEKIKKAPTREELISANAEQIRYVADAYDLAETAEEKNNLLKSVIDHIVYEKTVKCHRPQNPIDYLTLTIYPKIV